MCVDILLAQSVANCLAMCFQSVDCREFRSLTNVHMHKRTCHPPPFLSTHTDQWSHLQVREWTAHFDCNKEGLHLQQMYDLSEDVETEERVMEEEGGEK